MSGAPKQIEFENEVDSSGAMPPSMTFVNHPRIFPELDQGLVIEQARIWGVRFPLIERIILHRSVYDRPKYIIVIEVPGVDAPSKDEKLMAFMNQWQPDSLRALVEKDFQQAFKDPHEWMIEKVEPETEIIEVIEGACWLLYEKTSAKGDDATDQGQGDEGIDDALKRVALELMPKIGDLWSLILSGSDEPLKHRTSEDLQDVAVAILQDDPRKWLPIKEAHLKESSLYNTAPDRAARTFRHNLLGAVLKSQGHSVKNSRKLWETIKSPL